MQEIVLNLFNFVAQMDTKQAHWLNPDNHFPSLLLSQVLKGGRKELFASEFEKCPIGISYSQRMIDGFDN